MLDARAAALATTDFAFFALPPNRPSRSARRTEGEPGGARKLIRAIGRELTETLERLLASGQAAIEHLRTITDKAAKGSEG